MLKLSEVRLNLAHFTKIVASKFRYQVKKTKNWNSPNAHLSEVKLNLAHFTKIGNLG